MRYNNLHFFTLHETAMNCNLPLQKETVALQGKTDEAPQFGYEVQRHLSVPTAYSVQRTGQVPACDLK